MAPGPGFEPGFEAPQAPVIPSYTIRARGAMAPLL
ncbi:uncharacterized protein METZ01_LOCUS78064 [marine metagenome]|uniref:Uncharacterized protein n=1 Tax=marine metagenome TaxID=408172 RepID=A0A381UAJ6_9ZZZZ